MDSETEKRLLIAFILSFGLLLLWRAFFAPPAPPAQHERSAQSAAKTQANPGPGPSAPKIAKPSPRVSIPVIEGAAPATITLDSELYRVSVSTRGAVVTKWILKKYLDEQNKPLDLVNGPACAELGYPLSLEVADSTLSAKVNSAVYVAQPSATSFTAPQVVTFTYSDGKIQVRKELGFGANYEVKVKVSVFNGEHYLPVAVAWPGGFGDQSLPLKTRDKSSLAFYDQGNGIKTVAQKKVEEEHMIPGPLTFAGLEDQFFAVALLPDSPQEVFRFERQAWTPSREAVQQALRPLGALLGTPQPEPLTFRLFVAPKVLDVLQAENPALEGLVNFGWFSVIAKPLFLGMRWFYDHAVHNWGWAIVILTVLINMAFFPLKMKSLRSAQAMQGVAPQMKEIQNRYKQYKFNDPRRQRMNQEIMELYKKHGVNPLGGCLPMLVQLPIIYGFYEVLETSIAMRHAPWIFWIKDLSVPDPLYILPTLAIVLSFIMQKMTPMPATDPAQQRMMMFAPLAFGFIFYEFAAGVTLYYFTYSAVAVGQQLLINRMAPPSPTLSPPSAAGRAQAPGARKTLAAQKQ